LSVAPEPDLSKVTNGKAGGSENIDYRFVDALIRHEIHAAGNG
jgi:hypothetical protein